MSEETTKETSSTKKTGKQETLTQLIEQSNYKYPIILGALVDNGLYDKYLAEKENERLGLPNETQLTSTEFNKLIEKFLKKEV